MHMHLSSQTHTQDDPYADFWSSVSVHFSPFRYSVSQIVITFLSSDVSYAQQNYCALLEFSLFVCQSTRREP